jgi:hypothetical protein
MLNVFFYNFLSEHLELKTDSVFDLSTQNAIDKAQSEDNDIDTLQEMEIQDILIQGICSKAADSRFQFNVK